jgi:Smg protein
MFDVLVYLYETYYRLDACPAHATLMKKLSAAGFAEEEISEALDWLTELAETSDDFAAGSLHQAALSSSIRFYAAQELAELGTEAVGFIQFLELAKVLDPIQREIVIERGLAANDAPLPLDKLKIIVLMTLWSEGKEPGAIVFDELFFGGEDDLPRLLH